MKQDHLGLLQKSLLQRLPSLSNSVSHRPHCAGALVAATSASLLISLAGGSLFATALLQPVREVLCPDGLHVGSHIGSPVISGIPHQLHGTPLLRTRRPWARKFPDEITSNMSHLTASSYCAHLRRIETNAQPCVILSPFSQSL